MTAGRWITALAGVLLVAALAWALFVVLPNWYGSDTGATTTSAPAEPPARPTTPKIKATLFFVAENGASLVETEREIPFGEGILEQGRHILEAQLAAPTAPLVSPIPAGTTLRAFFVGGQRPRLCRSRQRGGNGPPGRLAERTPDRRRHRGGPDNEPPRDHRGPDPGRGTRGRHTRRTRGPAAHLDAPRTSAAAAPPPDPGSPELPSPARD